MLTYELKKAPGVPLYEALYRCIRGDILSGALQAGQKLPSKRALAQNLEVSKITVETAYNQLLAEGYICSREKVGYFVETVEHHAPVPETPVLPSPEAPREMLLDLTTNGTEHFPFSVWSRLQREVMLDYGETLLRPLPNRGIPELMQMVEKCVNRGLRRVTFLLPYSMGGQVERLHDTAKVLSCEYEAEGIRVEAICDEATCGRLRQYLTEEHR